MNILVIGGGGREHTIAWKLLQSSKVKKVYCAPGNGGTAQIAQNVPIGVFDFAALAQFVKDEGIDLTVVGPEDPLLEGIVDFFEERNLPIFGPSGKAAMIEGSKSFAKKLMMRYNIPTSAYESFLDYESAVAYVREQGAPIVVKADGLAAGKGVVVAETLEEAEEALRQIMEENVFGEAGTRVVVEECMRGEELSLLSFVDGATVKPMITSQDHKRIFNDDRGPNTGGMGTYAPVPQMSDELVEQIVETIVKPMAEGMAKDGIPFKGILYTGLMITEQGPKVVEFNARFGDPETQVILPLLDTDLLDIFVATIKGELDAVDVKWKKGSAVCVVMAAPGYPGEYPKGQLIQGLERTGADVTVFHAGTKATDEGIVTSGGRVLGVTATGEDLAKAREAAYQTVQAISFEGAQYRTDIAAKAMRHQQSK
ncbi:phosphoribosylamine--glycine ligase [Brevibacillus choshinensis]|uniref:phosphoribosylamine--glycine ligase n=1 Tax=Brevibacillus choshinensis TaxID=54911 RepID=UPI002E1DAD01|nr:phosphoribosylamine--glycine ligase [Brevibacillus choshinensis]MED4752427.1 phosphoribosylamine--glycine ligase [Brevibacillus choshinensis]MED4785088.1 phosphoribosylamine--glycine ligase [Brevibacillus choshinensis]